MSHKRNGNYKTEKDEWCTPQWLFDLLNAEFHLQLDAACTLQNMLCETGFTKDADALSNDWISDDYSDDDVAIPDGINRVWLNPPFSIIGAFMAKSYEESQKGVTVVSLVPVASDTKWWHNYVMKAQEIRFIKGRVRYVGYDEHGGLIRNSPTFASCVVIFHQKTLEEALENPRAPYIGKTIEQPKASVPA